MDYAAQLRHFGKKTITNHELAPLYNAHNDEALFRIIEPLIRDGYLQPVKSSLTNGNKRFPIHLKYRITLPAESFDAELAEIASLHPALQAQSYLQKKPALYRKYRILLCKLDQYLFRQATDSVPVSRKERSFEIFDEEKALDDRAFCGFLENLGIDSQVLGYYDTPEFCFNDYIPAKKPRMTLLICENKDIWFNIRRIMFEQNRFTLFGTQLDGVVYGCGNKVSQKGALTSYTHFMATDDVTYLYWGDIDRAGLDIYQSLLQGNPDMDIRLFVPAYEEMLRLAQSRTIPDSDDERLHHNDYGDVFAQLSSQGRLWMETSIRLNKRIPQEIISYAYLKENMR